MDIEAVSGAATVATSCTVVFILAAKSWQLLARSWDSHPHFSDNILREAAQRFRDELNRLSNSQSTYLGGALVFFVIYGVAYTLQARQLFAGYPVWQLYLFLGVLIATVIYATYRLVRTIIIWRQVKFTHDANVAIGHLLQGIVSGHGRVYHDVYTTAGIVDHVIVGKSGIYSVNVVARRAIRKGHVELENNELRFLPGDDTRSIVDLAAKGNRLEKEFRKLLGYAVRVRSVIAVPGWEITGQGNEEHLLVNERTLPMLRGWKDQGDHLMNEDVDTLMRQLTASCTRSAKSSSKAKKASPAT